MDELEIYDNQGFGNSSGLGRLPALLIVDFVNDFTDPSAFGGGNINEAIRNTKEVLSSARENEIPIVYTRCVYAEDSSDVGVFGLKARGLASLTENAPGGQIVDSLAPKSGEFIVRKTQPSAFFSTGLAPWLVGKGGDTVIVTGCTTSGCVRASVVDSMSNNFRTVVARSCVGDRAIGPHEANLFDMEQKYADLLHSEEIIAFFEKLNP